MIIQKSADNMLNLKAFAMHFSSLAGGKFLFLDLSGDFMETLEGKHGVFLQFLHFSSSVSCEDNFISMVEI